jgi:hypothetical protein
LTRPAPGVTHTPQVWTPDGTQLLFTADEKGTFTLHSLSLTDRTTTRFGDLRSTVPIEVSLSPDGRWIVYQASEQPASAISGIRSFVEAFPHTGAKFQVPLATAGHPVWAGDRVIFNTSASSNMAVGVVTRPTVSFTEPVPFSRVNRLEFNPAATRRNVDALPDGRLLGVTNNLSDDPATRDRFVIVVNWLDDLKARVPSR